MAWKMRKSIEVGAMVKEFILYGADENKKMVKTSDYVYRSTGQEMEYMHL
jgi:hypothetical protein